MNLWNWLQYFTNINHATETNSDWIQDFPILKTHISDKWVCGTETSQCIADPRINFVTLYRWMRIERVQRASAQFENLNCRLGPCLVVPQAVFACLLSPLYSHSAKRCVERNWRRRHWNASLPAADSLMMIVIL